MDISLTSVKELGYIKIHRRYCPSKAKRKEFFEGAGKLSSMLYTFKMPPYSFLQHWKLFKGVGDTCIAGIKDYCVLIDPLINTSDEVTVSTRRRFRNMYENMFKNYGEACNLSETEVAVLRDLGLKLPFILLLNSDNCVDKERVKKIIKGAHIDNEDLGLVSKYLEFYNALFNWNVLAYNEADIKERGRTILDIVHLLALTSDYNFCINLSLTSEVIEREID